MTTHNELREIFDLIRARTVKFERNAHLGQPIRSWDVYGHVIDDLVDLTGTSGEYPATRVGVADLCSRLLYRSKHNDLDRDTVHARCLQLLQLVDHHIAQAKAAR